MSDEFGDAYENKEIFFEKQQYCLCGLHALNNMLGRHVFDYFDIDFRNEVGNYGINQILDVYFKRFNLIMHCIFVGNDFRHVKDEDLRKYYERIGAMAWFAVDNSQCTHFLCQRRMHFFALRLIDNDSLIMIDSTKPTLFRFPRDRPACLGHLLVRVHIYCSS